MMVSIPCACIRKPRWRPKTPYSRLVEAYLADLEKRPKKRVACVHVIKAAKLRTGMGSTGP
jgi:hypothetical protein